ncbi:hypothetical protein OQA88_2388 [Cercophora sp. LCS_1]
MRSAALTPLFSLLAFAWSPPSYDGYRLAWSDSFTGPSGLLPNQGIWNIKDGDLGVNNELQTYKANPRNVQTSGGNTLQLVPWRDSSVRAGWTSGRIESKSTFVPQAGGLTIAEGVIRFGSNQIWTSDEVIVGAASRLTPAEPQRQRWRIVWDRTPNNWLSETITWFMNDQQFHQIRGDQIGDLGVWQSLAQKPLFFILNVAVGGDWPGYPNANTLDGYGAMMEVGYVALYHSL